MGGMGRIGGGARMGGMRGAHGIGSGPKSVKSAATAAQPKRCIGHSGQSSFTPAACKKSSGAQPPQQAAAQPQSPQSPDSGSSILQAILGALAPAAQKVAEMVAQKQQQGKQQGQQPVAAA